MKEAKREIIKEKVKKEKKQFKFKLAQVITKKRLAIATIIVMIIALIGATFLTYKKSNYNSYIDPELLRAMTYEQFGEGSDDVYSTDGETKVDNVKFSAFFLRDLDRDGNAEKIKGTCRQIGKQDTLYMEINILTSGMLKNGKIEIDGKNFNLVTALPKDNQIKNNAIGTDISEIEFNDMTNGTQKLITGIIRSGNYFSSTSKNSALGNNINNYTRNDNKVMLTGTYVDGNNNETEIRKEIDLTVDWYGNIKTTIPNTYQNYRDLQSRINEDTYSLDLSFNITTDETEGELLLQNNHIEATIPELNGEKPIDVIVKNENTEWEYNEDTGKLTIDRNTTVGVNGNITSGIPRTNTYSITLKYSLSAYESIGEDSVELVIPIEEYYKGYNNQNSEFANPKQSNTANSIVRVVYSRAVTEVQGDSVSINLGEYISNPYGNYVISKNKPMKIYNGVSAEEKDDNYTVRWYYYRGNTESSDTIIMKETPNGAEQKSDEVLNNQDTYSSMEEFTTNKGISFNNLTDILDSENGEIKVYDEELGNLLLTIDKTNISKYSNGSRFNYDHSIKHVRVEVTGMKQNTSLTVYHFKELDDEYITNNYTEEEFTNLKQIKSNLVVYRGETVIGNISRNALYELPTSVAKISIDKDVLSTQKTEKNNNIVITAEYVQGQNEIGWTNGIYLIKLPNEMVKTEINNVTPSTNQVSIDGYEYIENEQGKFIKVYTSNNNPLGYTITINCNLSSDPRIPTTNRELELYAVNGEGTDYYYKAEDIYDVNNNENVAEKINKRTCSISMVAPNSLLTNQTLSEFDDTGRVIVSPNLADISPKITNVETEDRTAKIGVQVKNNYSSDIADVVILGKIPFEGNTTVLTDYDLGSTFTTRMTEEGITAPITIAETIDIYYSINENPNKDLTDTNNNWVKAEDVTNWDNIKTFLIDFKDTAINPTEELIFYYTIKIPHGLDYNEKSCSHHGIWFSIITDEGKYRTQTEPNETGIRIAEKYDVNLTKYQTGKENRIQGAIYSITEVQENELTGESKTALTNSNGTLTFKDLYVEKTYEIKELRSPEEYELNSNAIRIVCHVNEEGELTVEKLSGTTKGEIIANTEEDCYLLNIEVEDEAKARLHITKTNSETNEQIIGARFKITGENYEYTKTTYDNGVTFTGLKVGEEYTIAEIRAEGYYLIRPIKVKIVNNNGVYEVQKVLVNGEIREDVTVTNVTEENGIPTANVQIENSPIPTYNLVINKIEKGSITEENPNGTKIVGAKFRLYKGEKVLNDYETDENGEIVINGLYQYEEDKGVNQTYKLEEIYAPEGFAKTMDITFRVQTEEEMTKLKLVEELQENQKEHEYIANGNTITLTVEDLPSFKLIKKDGETNGLLPNTKFAIYNVEEGEKPATNNKGEIIGTREIINGKEYYTLTTDERGEITANLPEGIYKAEEVEADEKYDISNKKEITEYFGIGASKTNNEGRKSETIEFSKSIGGTRNDFIYSITETTDGGYFVGGYFSGTIDLENGQSISSHGDWDGMVIKVNKEGECEWGKSIGGTNMDFINSIAETSDGGCLIGGYFYSSSIELGNGQTISNHVNTSYSDGMLIKYNREGECEWSKSIGGNSYNDDRIESITKTCDGGYLIGGCFWSSIELGNDQTISSHGSEDGMVIKYNRDMECEWGISIGGNSYDFIESVVETNDGGYLIGGYFSGTIDLENGQSISSHGDWDGMVIKYNRDMECEWSKSLGGTNNDYINSIIETSDGGCLVGGYFKSSIIDLGNDQTISNHGSISYTDGMIIKYSREGECEWGKSIGGSSEDRIESIIEANDGGYIVVGYFNGKNIDLGNGHIIINNGNSDGMIIKYSKEGECEWSKGIGDNGSEEIHSIVETRDGGYLIGGEFYGNSLYVGNGQTISNHGTTASDGMVIKIKEEYVPDAIIKWSKSFGGTRSDYIGNIVETNDGGYIIGGCFYSSSINLGNGQVISNHSTNGFAPDGMLLKFNGERECEWSKKIEGSKIQHFFKTSDGGYLIGGYFYSSSIDLGNGQTISNHGNTSFNEDDGMIIKYNRDFECEWSKSIGGTSNDYINSMTETSDGGYLIGGYFKSSSIDLGNGQIISNHGDLDGMIIKFNREGECEWSKSIGGSSEDRIESIIETSDGGYLIGGKFKGYRIDLGNGQIINNNGHASYYDGMIIKYNRDMECEWSKSLGAFGSYDDEITKVIETSDGEYLIGGCFESDSINLGNGHTITNQGDTKYTDGMLIKYNREGECIWSRSIGGNGIYDERIEKIIETSDGGYLIGGVFYNSSIVLENGQILSNHGTSNFDVMVIKYNRDMECEWSKSIGGTASDRIDSIIETQDGGYLIGGHYFSGSVNLDNGQTLSNTSWNDSDVMVIKVYETREIPEQQEIVFENYRKQYKITTDIQEIDNVKGGSISGEDLKEYEIVKYGDTSLKQIKMVPDESYEIIGVTINGEEWQYEAEEDGSYTMPQFTNVTEDKHVVVKYSLKDNKITINKEDSVSRERLEGAEFKLDQLEERTDPVDSDIIGELTDNSQSFFEADLDNEVTGKFGELTNNGTYYFVQSEDGSYIPTNGKTWQVANVEGATTGVNYTTANSYIPIDLTGLEGEYVVVVNAILSYNYAHGYVTITENTTAPSYNSTAGRFIYNNYYTDLADYTSMNLHGGRTYYLHLGYYRQSSTYYEDQIRINSIKLYKAKESTYNFIMTEGKYVSTNEGKDNTVCNSYIPIDLTDYSGKYNITVNAEVSSQGSNDYGYATITENTNRVAYNTSTGRLIYMSGTVNATNYSTILQGGKQYYLHLGYYKNANTSSGNDKFTVNSIHLSLNSSYSDFYHTTVTTNNQGQAITQIPFGKYEVTEIKSPEGYYLNEEPIIIEFRSTEGAEHEFTITNDKIGKTIVHHYIKDTTTSLAEDDIFTGRIKQEGETIPDDELDEYSYNSVPHMDFDKYELEKDVDGEYITPNNANGFFTYEDTIVTYFYVPKQIPLTVHHYIEGTTLPVLLTNGEEAEDEVRSGSEGEEYNTEPISEEELNEKYELIEIPENAEGTYEYNENIVTYYYKIKTFNVKTSVEPHEEIDLLGQTVSVKGGTISGENKETYETIIYGEDSIKEVKAMPDSGYEVKGITINNEPIDFTEEPDRSVILNKFIGVKENKNVVVLFGAAQGTVKVNHYLENTEERITDLDGNTVEQEVKTGTIGDIFATKEREDLLCKYELVSVPNVTSGQYGDEEQIFNYYYKIKEFSYEVNYLLKDDDTDDTNNESIHDPKTSDAIYHYGDTIDPLDEKIEIEGYKYDSTNIDTTLAIGEGENIINIYYIIDEDNTKERKYIVEYYISGDKQNDDTDEVKEIVQVLQPNTLEVRKDDINIVDKYEGYKLEKILLNDNEEPLEGLPDTVNSGDVIKVYYTFDDTQKREIKYTVEYYKDGELQEDTQTERKLVHVLDGDTLEVDQTKINTVDKYEGYTFEKTIPARIPSIVIDGDTIQVYYVKTKYPYRVEYYYNNVKDDAATETGEAYKEDRIENYTPKPKEGYEFEKVEKIPLTISDTEPNVIKVYYLPIRNITVKHIDKNTGEVLETEEKHGKQGYTVTTTAKDIDDYMLVERPDTEEYTYTEADQEVVYYYAKVSSGVLEKHLDLITGDPIVEDVLYEGYEGKPYQTSSKEIDGYYVSTNKELYESIVKENPEFLSDAGYESLVDFFEDKGIVGTDEFIPEDAEGEMEEGLITVRYYYTPIMKLIVKYKDILTGEEILETIEGEQVDSTVNETGSLNEAYNTTSKTFENYLNVSNKKYYKWYLTNHPEELEEAGVETVEEYLEQENIDPKAPYVPDNSEGIYEVVLNDDGTYSNEIHVTYYYAPEREVTIKYYDKTTGEEICEEVIKIGPDGDEYDVTEDKKEIEGYTLIEEPENPEGIYEENNTPRIFRYAKNTQVIVKYVDKETRESIDETENYKIEGYEGKAYETEQKEFNDYEYEEVEGDVEGTMPRDTIQVIYYYSRTSTPIDNTITNEINNNTVTNDVINNTITNDISNNTITNEIVNNTVNNTTNTNTTNTIKVTNTVTNTTKTTNTTKDSVIKRIINPKTGDIVPVVAYSTIFIVLFVNLMLARYKRAELEKYKRVSRISKTSIEEKNKKAKH